MSPHPPLRARPSSCPRAQSARRARSDLEQLLLLVREKLVDCRHLLVGDLLDLLLDPLELVGGQRSVLLQRLQLVAGGTAEVADGDAPFLCLVPDHLHELLAPLLGQRREREPDDGPVVGRVDAEVRPLDRLLDRGKRALVVGGNHEKHRVGDREAGDLPQGSRGSVVVDREVLDERRGGPPRAHGGELPPDVLDGLRHLLPGLLYDHGGEVVVHQRTSVPIRSPPSARRRFPGTIRSNTRIGRWLSLQNVIAVRSMTRRSLAITSMNDTSSKRVAEGSSRGSALYTPSTPPWVPFKRSSASISALRNAAEVSVVK